MSRGLLLGTAGALLVGSAGMLGVYFAAPSQAGATGLPAEAAGRDAVEQPPPIRAFDASAPVTLLLGERDATVSWAELGVSVSNGRVSVDAGVARARLGELATKMETGPADARMDLENRRIVPDVQGTGIDIIGSLARFEDAAAIGQTEISLPTVAIPADKTVEDFAGLDISAVMGTFETKFAVNEKSRNHNLKMAASKLNGHVLQPGEEFSFNDVVGARTEKEGYKIAHVITAGEMVDGLAGGTCQISTTLHGASFFAGLDIVRSLPHSRPSTYVHMGLDATVVYPYIDLKLRNPYEFPVVIHYKVARGLAKVEILGKERPYDKIVFEREVVEELEFNTVTRESDEFPVGTIAVEQEGFPGYKLKRYRKFYKDGKLVKQNKWKLQYRPVTEYVRMGINPDPTLPPPKQPKGHGPKAPRDKSFSLSQ